MQIHGGEWRGGAMIEDADPSKLKNDKRFL